MTGALSFVSACVVCEVPTVCFLTIEDGRVTKLHGGQLGPDGLTCDECLGAAVIAAVVGSAK